MQNRTPSQLGTLSLGVGLVLISIAFCSSTSDQYTPSKWVAVYLTSTVSLLCCALSSFPLSFNLKPYRWLGCAWIISFLVGLFFRLNVPYHAQILEYSAFSGLCISSAFFSTADPVLFTRTLVKSTQIATGAVLIYGLIQILKIEPFPFLFHNEFPASFFGFQNMTAEFVGYSILIQLYAIKRMDARTKLMRIPSIIFLGFSVIYLITLYCRAINLALIFAIVPYFLSIKKVRTKKTIAVIFVTALTVAVITPTRFSSFFENSHLIQIKEANSHIRIIRWMNTLNMIQDHPWGTGPGTFEFEYLPYKSSWHLDPEITETRLTHSPHNAFLGLAAENGILYSIVLFLLFATLLFRVVRIPGQSAAQPVGQTVERNTEKKNKTERQFLLSIFILTVIDAFFAFPMENAFPFFITAVATGMSLALVEQKFSLTGTAAKAQKIVLSILFCILFYFGSLFTLTKYTENNSFNHFSILDFTCKTFPSNWKSCIEKSRFLIIHRKLDEAEETLKEVLNRTPRNYLAMKLLYQILLSKGQMAEGCQYVRQYDALFEGASSTRGFDQVCAKF